MGLIVVFSTPGWTLLLRAETTFTTGDGDTNVLGRIVI